MFFYRFYSTRAIVSLFGPGGSDVLLCETMYGTLRKNFHLPRVLDIRDHEIRALAEPYTRGRHPILDIKVPPCHL